MSNLCIFFKVTLVFSVFVQNMAVVSKALERAGVKAAATLPHTHSSLIKCVCVRGGVGGLEIRLPWQRPHYDDCRGVPLILLQHRRHHFLLFWEKPTAISWWNKLVVWMNNTKSFYIVHTNGHWLASVDSWLSGLAECATWPSAQTSTCRRGLWNWSCSVFMFPSCSRMLISQWQIMTVVLSVLRVSLNVTCTTANISSELLIEVLRLFVWQRTL